MLWATLGPTSSAFCNSSSLGCGDLVQIAKIFCQKLRGALADKRNSQSIQDPRQRRLARRVDILEDFLGRFLAHALEPHQLLGVSR